MFVEFSSVGARIKRLPLDTGLGLTTYTTKSGNNSVRSPSWWLWQHSIPLNKFVFFKKGHFENMECTSLAAKIRRLHLIYFGHIIHVDSLEKAMMLGMFSGERRRGKQRTRWLDNISFDAKVNIQQWKEAVPDRVAWRALAYKVTKSPNRTKWLKTKQQPTSPRSY